MSGEAFENGTITARGPVSGVTIHAHMRQGPHAVMDCPLDLVVITEIMFLLAEQGRRPTDAEPLTLTPLTLLDSLRNRGVRSANGQPIGKNAVYDSFGRLRDKNYLDLVEDRDDRKVTGYRYDFYEFPAWNPNPTPLPGQEASSQVGPASGIAGSGNAGSRSVKRTSRKSSQVKAASGNAGTGNAGSRSGGCSSSQVGAGSGIGVHPPHPPEEEDSSSPYPSTAVSGSGPQEEEGSAINDEQIAAAVEFLQELPDPWQAGPATAKKLGPKLVAVAAEQGWELDEALVTKLTENPGGIRSYSKVLAIRVKDLPRRRSQSAPRKRADAQAVPKRPENVVPSEEGMVAVRAALEAMRGGLKRP